MGNVFANSGFKQNDPANWRDYRDEETGAWARITETHLVKIDDVERPMEWELSRIEGIQPMPMPGAMMLGVAVLVRNQDQGPGWIFRDMDMLHEFVKDLWLSASLPGNPPMKG